MPISRGSDLTTTTTKPQEQLLRQQANQRRASLECPHLPESGPSCGPHDGLTDLATRQPVRRAAATHGMSA